MWGSAPFRYNDKVYIYGFRNTDFKQLCARHTFSTTMSDYVTGWEYWNGTSWTSTVASAAGMTMPDSPITSINVIPWHGGFLGSSKLLNSAPEFIDPGTGLPYPDADGRIVGWYSENPWGPWIAAGNVYDDVRYPGWYSYSSFYSTLRGVPGLVAQNSLNSSLALEPGGIAIYGPHWRPAKDPIVPLTGKARRRAMVNT
jgi:hypothetical protein